MPRGETPTPSDRVMRPDDVHISDEEISAVRRAATALLGPESQVVIRLERIESRLAELAGATEHLTQAIASSSAWKMEAVKVIASTLQDACGLLLSPSNWKLQLGIVFLLALGIAGAYGVSGNLGDWLSVGVQAAEEAAVGPMDEQPPGPGPRPLP